MMREAENNNKIYILFCKGELKICDNNLNMSKTECMECIRKRKLALRIMNIKNIRLIHLKRYIKTKKEYLLPHNINNIDSLRKLRIESFDIGYAIASSLAEKLDETPFENCREQIALFFSEAYYFYECIKRIIVDYKINKGYIFNVRFCFSRAFFHAFLDKNITIYNHDRGANIYKYIIIKNKFLHDIDDYTERVNELWSKEENFFLKRNIADIYFKSRFIGKPSSYISFTKGQNTQKLPDKLDSYKKIIVIYNSSQFEYDNISDKYTYKFYKSQSDGIMKIVNSLKDHSDIGIFLREHPYQKNRNNNQRAALREIYANNFHLISAENDVSSYALLLKANVVVTFNSTMGIEATYWGIPSILCTNAIYENFNIAYQPSSHEEVIKLILSDLKPIISDDVYKYGYYNSVLGIDYKYYKPVDFFQGYFLGKNLQYQKNKSMKKKFMREIIKKNFPTLYESLKKLLRG
jgi:hypothetical protein